MPSSAATSVAALPLLSHSSTACSLNALSNFLRTFLDSITGLFIVLLSFIVFLHLSPPNRRSPNSPPFAEVALPDVLQWTASAFAGPLSPLPGRNGVVLTGNMWPASRPPFSFVYDGKPSETFFASWKRELRKREFPDHTEYHIEWDDPQTGLKATALV